MNPVDELSDAFNACLAIPKEDLRSSAEQNITRFIEVARKLEIFFLQKQLLLAGSSEDPEELNKLRARLAARENLLAKYGQKIQEWQKMLD